MVAAKKLRIVQPSTRLDTRVSTISRPMWPTLDRGDLGWPTRSKNTAEGTHSGFRITSATANFEFATEHWRGRQASLTPSNLSATTRQTIADTRSQSPADGSSGVANVMIELPLFGTTRKMGTLRLASRSAASISTVIPSSDRPMTSRCGSTPSSGDNLLMSVLTIVLPG